MIIQLNFPHEVSIAYDPDPNVNCQFDAVAHYLRKMGLHRNAQTLRKEAVERLKETDAFYRRFGYDVTYEKDIDSIALDVFISNDGCYGAILPVLTLVHFPKECGVHLVKYVCKQTL